MEEVDFPIDAIKIRADNIESKNSAINNINLSPDLPEIQEVKSMVDGANSAGYTAENTARGQEDSDPAS
jgi:hypothetical protein